MIDFTQFEPDIMEGAASTKALFCVALALADQAEATRQVHSQKDLVDTLVSGILAWRNGDSYNESFDNIMYGLGAL